MDTMDSPVPIVADCWVLVVDDEDIRGIFFDQSDARQFVKVTGLQHHHFELVPQFLMYRTDSNITYLDLTPIEESDTLEA